MPDDQTDQTTQDEVDRQLVRSLFGSVTPEEATGGPPEATPGRPATGLFA